MSAPAPPAVPGAPAGAVVEVPSRLRPAEDLLAAARTGLVAASTATAPDERYVAAHLAALRAASAVLAVRARPAPRRRGRGPRPTSAWVLLAQVAPGLAEWAQLFAAGARLRAAAATGDRRAVTRRQADDLLRDAEGFVALVEAELGQVSSPLLGPPVALAGARGAA